VIYLLRFAATALNGAEHTIRRRGFSKGSCRRLRELHYKIAECDEYLRSLKNPQAREEARRSLRDLQLDMLAKMRGIAFEVSEFPTAFKRHRQLLQVLIREQILEDVDDTDRSWDGLKRWTPGRRVKSRQARLTALLREKTKGPLLGTRGQAQDAAAIYLEWRRWTARLDRVSRSYRRAERQIGLCLQAVAKGADGTMPFDWCCDPDGDEQPTEEGHLQGASMNELVREAAAQSVSSGRGDTPGISPAPQRLRLEVAKLFEAYAQLLLDHKSVYERVNGKVDAKSLERATDCIQAGTAVTISLIAAAGSGEALREAGTVHVRFLLHSCLVSLAQPNNTTDANTFGQSQLARLDEAEAILRAVNPDQRHILWAVLPIHRAIVHLERAEAAPIRGFEGTATFAALCAKLREKTSISATDLASLQSADCQESSRYVRACLSDARRALDISGRALSENRKNVFWSTWYFQRMLSLIELDLWAHTASLSEPIPYLGLEVAPRYTPSVADECLENTLRMVRRDSYRLATVVDAYSRAALALHLRLEHDRQKLPIRQRKMRELLQKAVDRLLVVHTNRQEEPYARYQVNGLIHSYIEGKQGKGGVIARARRILGILDRTRT
jgi:hypothetical protein